MYMTTTTPLISIVVPVWNGEAYIAQTLESIFSQRTYVEVIAVDDGSTDNSRDVIAAYDCNLVSSTRGGIAKTCNAGIRHATGTYVMVLDQDDLLCEGALCRLLQALESDPTAQVAAGKARDFISSDLDPCAKACLAVRQAPYHGLMSGCMLLRRGVFDAVGEFNESYRAGQAVDYVMRIERSGIHCKKLDFVAAMRRLHANNAGRVMKNEQFSDYGAILRARIGKGAMCG